MRLKSRSELEEIVHRIIKGVSLPDGSLLVGHQARMSYFNLSQIEYGYVRYRINEMVYGDYVYSDTEDWSDF